MMRRVMRGKYGRALMAVVLLLAFVPNALLMEHWQAASAHAAEEPKTASEHSGHLPDASQSASDAQGQPAHCHVGPESCAASSGLSNAVVIAAALALTLLGGGVLALQLKSDLLWLFDLPRRLIVPPKPNLRSV